MSSSYLTTEELDSALRILELDKPQVRKSLGSGEIDSIVHSSKRYIQCELLKIREDARILGLSKNFDPLQVGGDSLHLSGKHTEVHVTKWLHWILAPPYFAPGLQAQTCSKLVGLFFGPKVNFSHDPEIHESIEVRTEVPITPDWTIGENEDRSLDLVVRFSTWTWIIEVKFFDNKIEKNWIYREFCSSDSATL